MKDPRRFTRNMVQLEVNATFGGRWTWFKSQLHHKCLEPPTGHFLSLWADIFSEPHLQRPVPGERLPSSSLAVFRQVPRLALIGHTWITCSSLNQSLWPEEDIIEGTRLGQKPPLSAGQMPETYLLNICLILLFKNIYLIFFFKFINLFYFNQIILRELSWRIGTIRHKSCCDILARCWSLTLAFFGFKGATFVY